MIITYGYLDQYNVIDLSTISLYGVTPILVVKAGSKIVGGLTSKVIGVRQNSIAKQYEGEV